MARFAGLTVLLFLLATATEAAGIYPGAIGCYRSAMYGQMVRQGQAGNSPAVQQLINDGFCVIIPSEATVTVLDETLADRWRIEFAFRGVRQIVWVAPEMVVITDSDEG